MEHPGWYEELLALVPNESLQNLPVHSSRVFRARVEANGDGITANTF